MSTHSLTFVMLTVIYVKYFCNMITHFLVGSKVKNLRYSVILQNSNFATIKRHAGNSHSNQIRILALGGKESTFDDTFIHEKRIAQCSGRNYNRFGK